MFLIHTHFSRLRLCFSVVTFPWDTFFLSVTLLCVVPLGTMSHGGVLYFRNVRQKVSISGLLAQQLKMVTSTLGRAPEGVTSTPG